MHKIGHEYKVQDHRSWTFYKSKDHALATIANYLLQEKQVATYL